MRSTSGSSDPGRELGQRGETEALEEQLGGPVGRRRGLRIGARLVDEPACDEGADHPSTLTPRIADTRARLTGCR